MSGTKKKGESPRSQRGPAHSKNRGVIRWLQGKFSRLLSWLSSLFGESNIPKALVVRILRAAQKWVVKMSPAQFIYLMVALAVIIVITLLYLKPPKPASPASGPVTVWVSEMPDSTDPNDTREAKKMIIGSLDVFDVKTNEPTDSTGIVMTIMVGCYRTKSEDDAITKELRIGIPELKWDRQPKTYETVSELPSDQIVRDIRTRILDKYPPEGTIYEIRELQPEEEVPPERRESLSRKVYLDIGYLAGVRERDLFQVVPSRKERFFRRSKRIELDEVGPKWSMALVSREQEIEKGWSVKWIKAGY